MAVEALHVDGVTKSFPGVKALNDVNLSVVPGEVHGIVGENGAGKSTLMSVISGSLIAEEGEVRVFGQLLPPGNASASRDMGVAIVRQEPALLPDLTVAENIYLGVPAAERPKIPSMTAWAKSALAVWSQDLDLSVSLRVEELPPEHRFIVEIVRALAARPKVLILDEPTEHLSAEDVNILFGHIRRLVSENVAVIYISHRVSEVRQIANRVSVLRNGESVGTEAVDKLTEQDIVNLIVGRELGSNYPPKAALEDEAAPNLVVKGLSGEHFSGIDLFVRPGEVVGLAGIDGNGQREFLRALAGFETFTGTVEIDGIAAKYSSVHHAVESGVAYVAADRHREGVISGLSVRDNVALRSLESFKRFGLVSSRLEKASVENLIGRFNVKTPSSEASISNLSGGNQQKTVLAGAFGANPRVLLLDEPTQGVDVGARSEIYSLIRERASETGMAVVVLSTDAKELAGICDRVAVFSRGKVVSELAGKDVTEEKVIAEALGSTAVREKKVITRSATARWLAGDFAPIAIVGVAIAVLATITQIVNPFFLTPMSIQSMLTLLMTLGMAAMAQTIVMMVKGIDLSVGPLMGLVVVIQSFLLIDGAPPALQALGWTMFLVVPVIVGSLNWVLVDLARIHPMVATLVTFTGIQAISLLMRPSPGGVISREISQTVTFKIGPVPVFFLLTLIVGLTLSWALLRTRFGIILRAAGSDDHVASLNAINPLLIRYFAYVGASVLAGVASIALMAQIGSGNALGGTSYTLASISAAVIGGVSLFGARGTFFAAIVGAALIQIANSVTTFLGLNTEWQRFLVGGLTLVAVAVYSFFRAGKR